MKRRIPLAEGVRLLDRMASSPASGSCANEQQRPGRLREMLAGKPNHPDRWDERCLRESLLTPGWPTAISPGWEGNALWCLIPAQSWRARLGPGCCPAAAGTATCREISTRGRGLEGMGRPPELTGRYLHDADNWAVLCPGSVFAARPLTTSDYLYFHVWACDGRGPRRMGPRRMPPGAGVFGSEELPSCADGECLASAIAAAAYFFGPNRPARTWRFHAPSCDWLGAGASPLDGVRATAGARTEQPPHLVALIPRPAYLTYSIALTKQPPTPARASWPMQRPALGLLFLFMAWPVLMAV